MKKFEKLAKALSLTFCAKCTCGCGACAWLMFTNEDHSIPVLPSIIQNGSNQIRLNTESIYASINLPDWINGADPDSVYEWAQHAAWNNQFLRDRMELAGLRLYRKYE